MERKFAILIVAIVALAVVAVAAIAALSLSLARGGSVGLSYVALVKIEGSIAFRREYGIVVPATSVEEYVEVLERARKDPLVKAVVLYVNSPGGEAAASERLYFAVEELAREKVVVAYVEGYGTSGAYMAILPAAKILASNSSLVGSIGVYSIVVSYRDLLGKLGIHVYTFKSGRLKDVGSPFRELTEEDREVLEGIVQGLFEVFKARVLKHREVDPEVFSGRPYLAEEGIEKGLVDGIGTLEDALREARSLAGLPEDAPVRELQPRKPGLFDLLFGGALGGLRAFVLPSYELLAMWPPPAAMALPP